MNFFLVFCRSRKKFDKYVKLNKLRNKCVIDIRRMMDEEGIQRGSQRGSEYFKVLVFKKLQMAAEKRKDIYYLPNFDSPVPMDRLLRVRELLIHHKFNLLFFHEEFREDPELTAEVFSLLAEFDASQVIQDY